MFFFLDLRSPIRTRAAALRSDANQDKTSKPGNPCDLHSYTSLLFFALVEAHVKQ